MFSRNGEYQKYPLSLIDSLSYSQTVVSGKKRLEEWYDGRWYSGRGYWIEGYVDPLVLKVSDVSILNGQLELRPVFLVQQDSQRSLRSSNIT